MSDQRLRELERKWRESGSLMDVGRLVAALEADLRPRALQLACMPVAFTANLLSAFLPATPPLRRSGRSP